MQIADADDRADEAPFLVLRCGSSSKSCFSVVGFSRRNSTCRRPTSAGVLVAERVVDLVEERHVLLAFVGEGHLRSFANGIGSQMLRPPVGPTEWTADW